MAGIGSAAEAIRAAQRLGEILPVKGLQDFNTQEILWHAILLREQFAAAGRIKRRGRVRGRVQWYDLRQNPPSGGGTGPKRSYAVSFGLWRREGDQMARDTLQSCIVRDRILFGKFWSQQYFRDLFEHMNVDGPPCRRQGAIAPCMV